MNKYILIISLCFTFSFSISKLTQDKNCFQDVWVNRLKKNLPKDICIPFEYHITDSYFNFDFNSDGLNDFAFDWNKKALNDGDTIYFSLYIKNKNGTFSHLRTYKNIYPIFFKSYNLNYAPKIENKLLRELHSKYQEEYLFHKLEIKKDLIIITIKAEAKARYIFTYKYDSKIKNWRYVNCLFYDYANGKEDYTPQDFSQKFGNTTLDQFTYFYWEE